jgi:hypothetical protein
MRLASEVLIIDPAIWAICLAESTMTNLKVEGLIIKDRAV